ncbi:MULTISPECIES: hypothetical protein [Microbacterium]|uniref:Uncharacterized protein n=1 Tax=Microbacterium algihabitans TaxID=3075992 RepID=A0ABU3RS56_9MICO|nr:MULTISPECIES: hypothetical protein [Microbacterium]MCD2169268.1 hypothetical protein [Microbacterium sp. JC 701]MCM3500639.1 hypothetical protein [Microbacterium sp. P26]MDU0325313.1 hypothetical protein [Microbacterium sp. KSW2-21]
MTTHDKSTPDHDSAGAGSESPEEGAAAQHDADEAATTEGSPAGDIS